MTSFLDIHCRYDTNVMQTISLGIEANTFGIMPT